MALKPLADRLIVRREALEDKSRGGILLPDNAQKKPQRGTVLAVGPGKMNKDGGRTPTVLIGTQSTYNIYWNLNTSGQAFPVQPAAHDQQLAQSGFTNLLFNAVDAMPAGGRLTISTRAVHREAEAKYVVI